MHEHPPTSHTKNNPESSLSLAHTELRIIESRVVTLEGYMEDVRENLPSLPSSPDAVADIREDLSLAAPLVQALAKDFALLQKVTSSVSISSATEGVEIKEMLDEALRYSERMAKALEAYRQATTALDEQARGKPH